MSESEKKNPFDQDFEQYVYVDAYPPSPQSVVVPVDDLAQEIRRVDGNHSLGAGALAEALLPFLSERLAAAPAPSSLAGGEVQALRTLLDNLVIAQSLSKEIRTHATDEARAYLYDTRLAALSPEAPAREGVTVREALEAADQCIADLVEIYASGGSMAVLDLAVKSLRDDAGKRVRKVLAEIKADEVQS